MTVPEELIRKAIENFKSQADEERQDDAAKRLSYYYGDFEGNRDSMDVSSGSQDYFREVLEDAFPETYAKIYKDRTFLNIVTPIVNERAMLFKEPISITSDNDAFNEAIPETLNGTLKILNRMTELLGTTAARVKWDERRGQVAVDVMTPDFYSVVQNTIDPTIPDAYIVRQALENTITADYVYYIFTADEYQMRYSSEDRSKGRINLAEENPYRANGEGVIPIVSFHASQPVYRYFQLCNEDLINAQDAVNKYQTYISHVCKTASCGIPFLSNYKGIANPKISPLVPIMVETSPAGVTPEFRYVKNEADIAQLRETLNEYIDATYQRHGLCRDRMTAIPSSGYALMLQNRRLLEHRADMIELWRPWVNELIEKIILVYNTHTKATQIPENVEYDLDFGEIRFDSDPLQEIALHEKKIELGIESPSDVLMAYNPDLTPEEAEQQIQRNMTARNATKRKFSLVDMVRNETREAR